jgi:hypothetical protein
MTGHGSQGALHLFEAADRGGGVGVFGFLGGSQDGDQARQHGLHFFEQVGSDGGSWTLLQRGQVRESFQSGSVHDDSNSRLGGRH